MIALWIFLGILGFLLLVIGIVLLLHVGGRVVYSEDGLKAYAIVGPVKLDLLKMMQKPKKEKATKEKKDTKSSQEKKGGRLDGLKTSFGDVLALLKELSHRLRIDELTVYISVGGAGDPCAAAMKFGGAYAVFGMIIPALENICTVKRRDLRSHVDFEA